MIGNYFTSSTSIRPLDSLYSGEGHYRRGDSLTNHLTRFLPDLKSTLSCNFHDSFDRFRPIDARLDIITCSLPSLLPFLFPRILIHLLFLFFFFLERLLHCDIFCAEFLSSEQFSYILIKYTLYSSYYIRVHSEYFDNSFRLNRFASKLFQVRSILDEISIKVKKFLSINSE